MLSSQNDFASNWLNTNKFGLNLLRYFASKVWNNKVKISGSAKYLKSDLFYLVKFVLFVSLKEF